MIDSPISYKINALIKITFKDSETNEWKVKLTLDKVWSFTDFNLDREICVSLELLIDAITWGRQMRESQMIVG